MSTIFAKHQSRRIDVDSQSECGSSVCFSSAEDNPGWHPLSLLSHFRSSHPRLLMVVEYKGKGPVWLTPAGVCFTWCNEGRELKQSLSADHQCGKRRGGDVVKLFSCAFSSKKEEKQGRNESVEMISPQPSYFLHPSLLDKDKRFQ